MHGDAWTSRSTLAGLIDKLLIYPQMQKTSTGLGWCIRSGLLIAADPKRCSPRTPTTGAAQRDAGVARRSDFQTLLKKAPT